MLARNLSPAVLEEEEWEQILAAFERSSFRFAIEVLRRMGNTPQTALRLLGADHAYSGDETVNGMLRTHRLEFRLSRFERKPKEDRRYRKLALVRKPDIL